MRVEARDHYLTCVDRDLVLRGELRQRAVRPQLRDAVLDLGAEGGCVGLPVVDAELVARREREADRDLAGVRLRLERERRVLREDGVGATEQHLRDRVVVARIALQREADLRLQRLQVLLVLRAGLHGDDEALELVRAVDLLRVTGLDDQHAMRVHVRDDSRLLRTVGRDEDAADHGVALLRVQRRDEARERGLRRRRGAAPRLRERDGHVDVEADDLAARRRVLHRRERGVRAPLERRRRTARARSPRARRLRRPARRARWQVFSCVSSSSEIRRVEPIRNSTESD